MRMILWLVGIVGVLWLPVYNANHAIQRPGDDWYGPWLFFAGSFLLLALLAEWVWRRFRQTDR
jgi:hypothetical protein